MIPTSLPILAQASDALTRTTFEWGRIQDNADWILPVGVCLAIMVFVRAMYVRDSVELHPALGWFLTVLRTVTFLALLILYLQPQWRTEREVKRNSRALVLIDTSLSMSLADADSSGEGEPKGRIRQVAETLAETDLLDELRKTHDVVVYRFNEGLDQDRKTFDKTESEPASAQGSDNSAQQPSNPTAPSGAEAGPANVGLVEWMEFLAPVGSETRLGLGLRQLVNDHSGAPLSGIVVFTDGGHNTGVPPEAAIRLAQEREVPIFTVGVGSPQKRPNVRVSDLVAPARAYPGDDYTVTAYLQAQELVGRSVRVELLSRKAGQDDFDSEASEQVELAGGGEPVAVKFQLTPAETGRRTLRLEVTPPEGDYDSSDNVREVDIEIVDHKNRVLLFAGGPSREYRFVRTLLYRDRSTTLHVLLQTAQPGISQEADKILDDFPTTREEMFEYDCLLAFDPDWAALSSTQVDRLEEWVAGEGGGMVAVAGPVFAGQSISGWGQRGQNDAMAKIQALYPIVFQQRYSTLDSGSQVTEEPWPLEFTREGLEAEFLWLDDTAAAGREAWASFEGVYGYCPIRGEKPGATVLARFSDPRTGSPGKLPIFFASQFYGSGRVFYIGSGEMWRLRKLDDTYFTQFYTKLLRHVSQGRLLRGSARGVLLVGQDRYLLGSTVEVRTQLKDAQRDPLEAAGVTLQVIRPDQSVQVVKLAPDPARIGTFLGRFPVLEEGTYRLELPVPESDAELLTRRIHVKVPDLERENPELNAPLLGRIATGTGGQYYDGPAKILGTAELAPVARLLKDRTKTDVIPEAPDPLWEETWQMWMMIVLCSLLCFEWLIRRLVKLA